MALFNSDWLLKRGEPLNYKTSETILVTYPSLILAVPANGLDPNIQSDHDIYIAFRILDTSSGSDYGYIIESTNEKYARKIYFAKRSKLSWSIDTLSVFYDALDSTNYSFAPLLYYAGRGYINRQKGMIKIDSPYGFTIVEMVRDHLNRKVFDIWSSFGFVLSIIERTLKIIWYLQNPTLVDCDCKGSNIIPFNDTFRLVDTEALYIRMFDEQLRLTGYKSNCYTKLTICSSIEVFLSKLPVFLFNKYLDNIDIQFSVIKLVGAGLIRPSGTSVNYIEVKGLCGTNSETMQFICNLLFGAPDITLTDLGFYIISAVLSYYPQLLLPACSFERFYDLFPDISLDELHRQLNYYVNLTEVIARFLLTKDVSLDTEQALLTMVVEQQISEQREDTSYVKNLLCELAAKLDIEWVQGERKTIVKQYSDRYQCNFWQVADQVKLLTKLVVNGIIRSTLAPNEIKQVGVTILVIGVRGEIIYGWAIPIFSDAQITKAIPTLNSFLGISGIFIPEDYSVSKFCGPYEFEEGNIIHAQKLSEAIQNIKARIDLNCVNYD